MKIKYIQSALLQIINNLSNAFGKKVDNFYNKGMKALQNKHWKFWELILYRRRKLH